MDWIFFISIAVFHVVGVFLHELGQNVRIFHQSMIDGRHCLPALHKENSEH